jgi:ATP-dependent helicase/nuclease subunit B
MPGKTSPGLVPVACAAHEILARAAADLVGRERGRLPDLAHAAVVVLPDLHAAGDAARALRAAAGVPALLLPRITTLERWAADVPLGHAVASRAAREALLYRELQKRSWLESADLWAVAAELAGLFDELTRHHFSLPADLAAFNRQLEQAYRARAGESLTFEARLVHELWHALAAATGETDAEAAYQLRLSRVAANAAAPLYALGLTRLAPSEERFLEGYAARAAVHRYDVDRAAGGAAAQVLAAAWPQQAGDAGLRERAGALKAEHPASPLAGKLRIIGAAGAEQEAQAVDVTVREWLLTGKRRIAVVVQDRLVARRARALLERAQVQVKDEAGWAFSTTSAATAIGRWLDVAGGECYYRDLLDLMKSPFAFHDWPRDARRAAVWRLEGYIRKASVVSGIGSFIQLAEAKNDPEIRQMLVLIRDGAAILGRRVRTIPQWLDALVDSLRKIGVHDGLAADNAGQQLLELLERLAGDLAVDALRVDFSDWRRWLARQLEAATFRDATIESPVVFTSLAATRLRRFDAVLVLGADAAHLPGPDPVSMFFNQGVRAELELPTWAERVREMEDQLAALVAAGSPVAVTWQRMTRGERNLLSPLVERLSALHLLAYEDRLFDPSLEARLARAEVRPAAPSLAVGKTRAPAPAAGTLLPGRISASGYNSLVACPYQFYARYVLRLGELDEVQEEIEKGDYGSILHGVLTEFHRAHPVAAALDPAAAQSELERLSEQAFAGFIARNYFARAWLARWNGLIPAYLAWQREREGSGWRWSEGEVERSIEITTPGGRKLTVHGRLDRVDSREPPAAGSPRPQGANKPNAGQPSVISHQSSPEFSVVDYKARSPKALEDSLARPGEDVQLAVYALLWGEAVTEALFLSVDRRDVEAVAPEGGIQALAQATHVRLTAMFDALAAGARLPAQGTEGACEYCDARGLCRKGHWHD